MPFSNCPNQTQRADSNGFTEDRIQKMSELSVLQESQNLDMGGVGELVDGLEGEHFVGRGECLKVGSMGLGVAGDVEEVFGSEGEEIFDGGGAEAWARWVDDSCCWGVIVFEGGEELGDIPFVDLHVSDIVGGAIGLGIEDSVGTKLDADDVFDVRSAGHAQASCTTVEIVEGVIGR